MKVEIKGKELIITVEMQTPTPSASGKTLVIASSHGICVAFPPGFHRVCPEFHFKEGMY
jgi:hypothetical protein